MSEDKSVGSSRTGFGYWGLVMVVFVSLAFLCGMMEYRARLEVASAERALAANDLKRSVKHYWRALNWYLPYGASQKAAEDLFNLGVKLNGQGKKDQAGLAFSRLRAGLYAARGFYTPRQDLIRISENYLAEIMAEKKLGPEAAESNLASQKLVYLNLLRKNPKPVTVPSVAASFGFLVWIIAVVLFIFRFTNDNWSMNRAWFWAFIWTVGFIVWLWGLKWA